MAFNKQVFRKDKPKPVKLRIVCEFTLLENIARNDSVQPVRSLCVNRANADYFISNGVKILTIFERVVR